MPRDLMLLVLAVFMTQGLARGFDEDVRSDQIKPFAQKSFNHAHFSVSTQELMGG